METIDLFRKLRFHWRFCAILTLSIILGSLILSLFQPFQYRTDGKVLIIQKQTSGFDPYLAIKATERLAEELSQIIFTSSFITRVSESGYRFPPSFFPSDPIGLKKQWKKWVTVNNIPAAGILKIQTYHEDRELSLMLAKAIADVLVTQGDEYHGGGEEIVMKVVDDPVASARPVRPNIVLNVGSSLAVGILLSTILVFFMDDREENMVYTEINDELNESDVPADESVAGAIAFMPTEKIKENHSTEDMQHTIPIHSRFPREPLIRLDEEF